MNKSSEKPDSFPSRIRKIIEFVGSAEKLAKLSGLSPRVVGKYLAGESEPARTRLISMAKAADVSLEWLATGEGPMKKGDPATQMQIVPPLEEEPLQAILEVIEEMCQKYKVQFIPAKKARIIIVAYKLWMSLPADQRDKKHLAEFIEIAA